MKPILSNCLRQPTKFTCCARCGAVAPRVLGPTRQKIADKAQAGRLFCALPRGRYGHKNGLRRRRRNPFSSGKSNVVRHIMLRLNCILVFLFIHNLELDASPTLNEANNRAMKALKAQGVKMLKSDCEMMSLTGSVNLSGRFKKKRFCLIIRLNEAQIRGGDGMVWVPEPNKSQQITLPCRSRREVVNEYARGLGHHMPWDPYIAMRYHEHEFEIYFDKNAEGDSFIPMIRQIACKF